MRVAAKIATVLLLVLSLNLHWMLLQTVAWTGMVVSYSRHVSLGTAISMTFDGQHPCSLCKAIESGRAASKERDAQLSQLVLKFDVGVVWQGTDFDFTCDAPPIRPRDLLAVSHLNKPPKPRPRGAFSGLHASA